MKNLEKLPEIEFLTDKKSRIERHLSRYDSDTTAFATWWAHFMQEEINNGEILDNSTIMKCVLLAKKKVSTEVAENMQTNAACLLNAVWKYGETIYRWKIEVNEARYRQKEIQKKAGVR